MTNLALEDGEDLNVGNYTVYKDLRINESALNDYANQYVASLQDDTNACYVAPFVLNLPDTCNIDCDTCVQELGSKIPYIRQNLELYYSEPGAFATITEDSEGNITVDNYNGDNNIIEVNSFANGYATEWELTLQACKAECELQDLSGCEIFEALLMADVSPEGQYGNADITFNNQVVDPLSVFNDAITDPQGNSLRFGDTDYADNDWRHPVTPYTNDDGSEARIIVVKTSDNNNGDDDDDTYQPAKLDDAQVLSGVTPDGAPYLYILPQDLLEVEDFFDAWEGEWARALLPYHPEYHYYEYALEVCGYTSELTNLIFEEGGATVTQTLDSYAYNDYLDLVETFAHAQQAQLLGTNENIMNFDPYFDYSLSLNPANTNTHLAIMQEAINTNYEGSGKTMLEVAYETAICDGISTCNIPANLTFNNLSGLGTVQKDRLWETYKDYYIGLKQKIQYVFLNQYAITKGYYNGCLLGQDENGENGLDLRLPASVMNTNTLANYSQAGSISLSSFVPQICDENGGL
ncbi:MAG: hypothetical protein HRT68_10360, partial [Flavobacteriaceae bacterium]|nr:hypothetical protein [Flavobacteriaceae bacterium]